jgi:dihydrofolate reductase
MKTYLFAAMSLDGFIATEKGDEDFLADEHWSEFKKIAKKTGCFIVGRKAYDAVNKWGDYGFDEIKALKIIVSQNKDLKLKQNYLLANSPAEALQIAEGNKFKEVVVAGGGHLNSAFLDNNLIDEIVLTVEPCVLGKGISFFSNKDFSKKLKLNSCEKLKKGIVKLSYRIIS